MPFAKSCKESSVILIKGTNGKLLLPEISIGRSDSR